MKKKKKLNQKHEMKHLSTGDLPCLLTETICQTQGKHMTFMVNLKVTCGNKLSRYFFFFAQ